MGAGGGGGGREYGLKCPHYPIDYEGGGGGWNLEFCRYNLDYCYIGISSVRQQRTLLYRQNTCDLPTEYGEELRACFRPKTTKLSARLAQLINAFFFFSSFRLVGVVITKQINQNTDILYRQNNLFYQIDSID